MASKTINYLSKDFESYKANLIEFAKTYYPNTYNDFSEASPGMMFIEMAAYVGDVLSMYTDYSMKENLLDRAQEAKNVYAIAQTFGYKPRVTTPSTVRLNIYQLVPSINSGINSRPDFSYCLIINAGATAASTGGVNFTTLNQVDFAASSSLSPTDVSVYQINQTTGTPEYYLLKKQVDAEHGQVKSQQFQFSSATPNASVTLIDQEVIAIDSIVDSDDNIWYQVDNLAQDTIFKEDVNDWAFDPQLSEYRHQTPKILSMLTTPRRFKVSVNDIFETKIHFGSGISAYADEKILPNANNLGTALPGEKSKVDRAFDPSNFLYSRTYGLSPANTTLTVNYRIGSGVSSNVASKTITSLTATTQLDEQGLDPSVVSVVKGSIAVINDEPATGGSGPESVADVKRNAMAYFSAQKRIVTKDDYILRSLSMPQRFGHISKAYVIQDQQLNAQTKEETKNPLAVNLYTLGEDVNGKLTNINSATKLNLKNYLSQYRMLTDAVNIKDGFVINFGIFFDIVVLPSFNSNAVLLNCIDRLKETFDTSKMNFGKPIIKKDVVLDIASIEGVQSIIDIRYENKYKEEDGYSGNKYDMNEATRNDMIYPSLDPSVFEIKNPDTDIIGRVVNY
jgi:hypothetical protein